MSNKNYNYNREIKPFRYNQGFNPDKISSIFSSISNMDTQEILNTSTELQIPLSVTDDTGNTLIHKILLDGTLQKNELNRLNVIKFLVNNNVNPDSPNRENITALHLACSKQYPLIIEYLLELGVDPNSKDNLGNTPFHYYLNGKLKKYVSNNIIDLIPEGDMKKLDESKEINEIEKIIFNSIKDNEYLKSIEKTILASTGIDSQLKDTYSNYLEKISNVSKVEDSKQYRETIIQNFNLLSDKIISKWSNFSKVENIELHPKTNNSWPNEAIKLSDATLLTSATYVNSNQAIIRDLDNGSVHDTIRNVINTSVTNIEDKVIELRKDSENKDYEINDNFIQRHQPVGPNIGLDITIKALEFINQIKIRNEQDLLEECADGADNFVDINRKIFIGGSRKIDMEFNPERCDLISNLFKESENIANRINRAGRNYRRAFWDWAFGTEERKVTGDDIILQRFAMTIGLKDDNSNGVNARDIYNLPPISPLFGAFNTTNAADDLRMSNDDLNLDKFVWKNLFTNDNISEKELSELPSTAPAGAGLTEGAKYNRKIISENRKNVNLDNFHRVYNLVMTKFQKFTHMENENGSPQINYLNNKNRLEPKIKTSTLYLFAAYINYQNDMILSLTQSLKLLLIPPLFVPAAGMFAGYLYAGNPVTGDLLLSLWIYLLLSKKRFHSLFDICKNVRNALNLNSLTNDKNDPDYYPSIFAKYCQSLINNPDGVIVNLDEVKSYTNRDYVSKSELLVYAITKYYNEMPQKPIQNHFIDTIFIIRRVSEEAIFNDRINLINKYIRALDIDLGPNDASLGNPVPPGPPVAGAVAVGANNGSFNLRTPGGRVQGNQIYHKNPDLNTLFNLKIAIEIDNDTSNFDNLINLMNLEKNILPSRKYFYLTWRDLDSTGNLRLYYMTKFYESYYLGLTFLECFPQRKFYKLEDNVEIKINQAVPLVAKKYPNNANNPFLDPTLPPLAAYSPSYYPYLGYVEMNYEYGNNVNELQTRRNISLLNLDYQYSRYLFGYQNDWQMRPSSKEGFNFVISKIRNKLNQNFNLILGKEQRSKIDFIKTLKSSLAVSETSRNGSRNLFKIFPIFYPILICLSQMKNEILNIRLPSVNDFPNLRNIENLGLKSALDLIVNELNNINAHFFINYYIFTKKNVPISYLSIPSFYYYKIPKPESQDKSLVINMDKDLQLKKSYDAPSIMDSEFNKDDRTKNQYDGANSKFYYFDSDDVLNSFYISSILGGFKYINTKSINANIKFSKSESLPPSLSDNFRDFYRYSILQNIIEFPDNVDLKEKINNLNKFYFIENNDKEITYRFRQAEILDIVTRRYLKWFVRNTVWKLLTKDDSTVTRPDLLFDDFTSSLNNEASKLPVPSYRRQVVSYYRINEKLDEDDSFIIYSNDYTNNTLSKQFLKYDLNPKILEILLNYDSKPFINNKNNRSAIYTVLSNYYYPIFSELTKNKILYQQFYDSVNKYNIQMPVYFMYQELKNHLEKLIGNSEPNQICLKNFSFNQYNSINLIIRSNERFGNNILRNLELSYSIVGYITCKFLYKNIFNLSSTFSIENLKNTFKINDLSKEKIKEPIDEMFKSGFLNKVYKLNYYNYLQELQEETNQEINRLEEEIKKIDKFNASITQEFGKERLIDEQKKNKLVKELQKLKNEKLIYINESLSKASSSVLSKIRISRRDYEEIVSFYNRFVNNNDKNRGSYLLLWEKYFESNIEDDRNLLLLKACKKINNLFTNKLEDQQRNVLKDLSEYNELFDHVAIICERYFKSPKYLKSNETLVFVKDLLVHITKNVICYGFEVSIRKTLFKYLYNRSANPNVDNIVDIISSMFASIDKFSKDNDTLSDLLYNKISKQLVINSTPIYEDRAEELNYEKSSIKEIFSNFVNLLEISSVTFDSDSEVMKNLSYIIDYFSEITGPIIYNWHVTIENYFKFTINQSRINKTFIASASN